MNAFPLLNLPYKELRLKTNAAGRTLVYDRLRRRFVTLTPEEWVRQHFVEFMIDDRGFPPALLANEVGVSVGGVNRRCDTVLFHRADALPRLVIEYKAPHVAITEAVFMQVQSYNSVLRADYLVVSNGMQHFCCRMHYVEQRAEFLPELPHYASL